MPNISLTSGAFDSGASIPERYTCEGENISPPLTISGLPEGAQCLVLIVDDPDAPAKTFVHWVAFNLPPDTTVIAEGADIENDVRGVEGVNDFGDTGYGGPCPPPGSPHRYQFRLYALDTRLDLEKGASKKQVTQTMDGHVLAETNLNGTYARGT